MAIYGMAKLLTAKQGTAAPPHAWSEAERAQLTNVVKAALPGFTEGGSQTLSNAVWSIGRLDLVSVSSRGQSAEVAAAILFHVTRQLQSSPCSDVVLSSVITGLSLMDIRWAHLPMQLQSSVCSTFCRQCTKMSPQALGNTLYHLGRMGCSTPR
jgi:hypothetical protein